MKINFIAIGMLAGSLLFPLAQDARAFYNAQTGCWPNRDPFEEAGSINLYEFSANIPISDIDPVGEHILLRLVPTLSWDSHSHSST